MKVILEKTEFEDYTIHDLNAIINNSDVFRHDDKNYRITEWQSKHDYFEGNPILTIHLVEIPDPTWYDAETWEGVPP